MESTAQTRNETMNTGDHDILVELKTSFKIFTDQYKLDIFELKNDTAKTLSSLQTTAEDHDKRIRKLEDVVEQVKPIETVAEFRTLQRQFRDFVVRADLLRFIAGGFGAIVFFALTQLINYLTHLK